jgi:hypothetical protein
MAWGQHDMRRDIFKLSLFYLHDAVHKHGQGHMRRRVAPVSEGHTLICPTYLPFLATHTFFS